MSSKVTKVASLSFGVYLWHENNNVREYIWNQAKLSNVADNWLLLLVKILGVAILVFTIGILMESIRRVVIYGGDCSKIMECTIREVKYINFCGSMKGNYIIYEN